MAITATEAFNLHGSDELCHARIVDEMKIALCILSLDVFENRYGIFRLPHSFTVKEKKSLQHVFKNFEDSSNINERRDYNLHVLNFLEKTSGKSTVLELIDWIKNVTSPMAQNMEQILTDIYRNIYKNKISPNGNIPLRMERYFAFREVEREFYLSTQSSQELDPDCYETNWDKSLYEKYTEILADGDTYNCFDASLFVYKYGNAINAKISWENACSGIRPTKEEIIEIENWILKNSDPIDKDDMSGLSHLTISPILKSDYIRRKIIAA